MQGEMLRSNGEAYERWRELEERHEKALTSLQEQTAAIEKLSARNAELKEINSQLDFQWGEKYAALRDAKEKENVEERERRKREVEELLAMPEGFWHMHAMIPIGYPTGRWGRAERQPAQDFVYSETWGEPVSWEAEANWAEPEGYGRTP